MDNLFAEIKTGHKLKKVKPPTIKTHFTEAKVEAPDMSKYSQSEAKAKKRIATTVQKRKKLATSLANVNHALKLANSWKSKISIKQPAQPEVAPTEPDSKPKLTVPKAWLRSKNEPTPLKLPEKLNFPIISPIKSQPDSPRLSAVSLSQKLEKSIETVKNYNLEQSFAEADKFLQDLNFETTEDDSETRNNYFEELNCLIAID